MSSTSTSKGETGRVTLRFSARTIKDLRLLAVLSGVNLNTLAEELLLKGGLQAAVDLEMNRTHASEESRRLMVPVEAVEPIPIALASEEISSASQKAMSAAFCLPPGKLLAGTSTDEEIPW